MMADKAPCLAPEEVLNDWTFSTDAERDRYFRSGLSRREEAIICSTFVGMGGGVLDVGWGYGRTSRQLAETGLAGRTECIGLPPRTVLAFTNADGSESLPLKSVFQQEMIRHLLEPRRRRHRPHARRLPGEPGTLGGRGGCRRCRLPSRGTDDRARVQAGVTGAAP